MQKIAIQDLQNLLDVQSHDTTDVASTLETLGFTVSRTIPGSPDVKDYAEFAEITVEGNPIRHGKGTPTTSLGHLAYPGDVIELNSQEEIETVKFKSAATGVHGTLQGSIGFR